MFDFLLCCIRLHKWDKIFMIEPVLPANYKNHKFFIKSGQRKCLRPSCTKRQVTRRHNGKCNKLRWEDK